jgi:FAD:protein FMN transferase
MRRVEQLMGMPVSIDIPQANNDKPFRLAFQRLREIDGRFSTYKPDSELSRYRRGQLKRFELSEEMKLVMRACARAEKNTDGYFSAGFSGGFDPTGYVKGWAIAEAGKCIEKHGYKTYCIGAGGDILARSGGDKVWEIGIQDPRDKSKILNKLSISNGAVATSGSYERGAHIINPKTQQPANELSSVTISGPDIIKADVLATACFAMGRGAAEFIKTKEGYTALIIG